MFCMLLERIGDFVFFTKWIKGCIMTSMQATFPLRTKYSTLYKKSFPLFIKPSSFFLFWLFLMWTILDKASRLSYTMYVATIFLHRKDNDVRRVILKEMLLHSPYWLLIKTLFLNFVNITLANWVLHSQTKKQT